jgi:hypothetical protein
MANIPESRGRKAPADMYENTRVQGGQDKDGPFDFNMTTTTKKPVEGQNKYIGPRSNVSGHRGGVDSGEHGKTWDEHFK